MVRCVRGRGCVGSRIQRSGRRSARRWRSPAIQVRISRGKRAGRIGKGSRNDGAEIAARLAVIHPHQTHSSVAGSEPKGASEPAVNETRALYRRLCCRIHDSSGVIQRCIKSTQTEVNCTLGNRGGRSGACLPFLARTPAPCEVGRRSACFALTAPAIDREGSDKQPSVDEPNEYD